MGMKGQTWWLTPQGSDFTVFSKTSRVFDWQRRESRRRGEELFRHDVDNFELTDSNLVSAPGAHKKKRKFCRTKYGHLGRTAGRGGGNLGCYKNHRPAMIKAHEGGMQPINIRVPKLQPENQMQWSKHRRTRISMTMLNACEDGAVVSYEDLVERKAPNVPVINSNEKKNWKFHEKGYEIELIKPVYGELERFSTKNLTVFAHFFDSAAREKIEELGGACIRLSQDGGYPVDLTWLSKMKVEIQEAAEAAADEATTEEAAEGGEA